MRKQRILDSSKMRSRIRTQTIPAMKNRRHIMARKSRYLGYVNAMKKGRAAKPALSIKGKLSQMKEKAKEVNKKPIEAHGEGES
jgi:hypothetical protein